MPVIDPRDRMERFVLRARRMMAHSLVREHSDLLTEFAEGTINLTVQVSMETGESEVTQQVELPREEAFESFAARLRPFVMRKESVYWELVLDALAELLSEETLTDVIDVEDLRNHWRVVAEGSKVCQAYYVMTGSGQLSDVQLADLWLNSDALHTQPIQSPVGNDLSLNQRYQAAVGVYARLGAVTNHNYILVKFLVKEGLLELNPSVFTTPVLAETSVKIQSKVYSAELGAEMPTDLADLDPKVWKPLHEDLEMPIGTEDPPD